MAVGKCNPCSSGGKWLSYFFPIFLHFTTKKSDYHEKTQLLQKRKEEKRTFPLNLNKDRKFKKNTKAFFLLPSLPSFSFPFFFLASAERLKSSVLSSFSKLGRKGFGGGSSVAAAPLEPKKGLSLWKPSSQQPKKKKALPWLQHSIKKFRRQAKISKENIKDGRDLFSKLSDPNFKIHHSL